MMKTRRKSKAAAAAAAEAEVAAAEVSRQNSPAPQATTASDSIAVPLPDDLDTDILSNVLFDVPLNAPTPDAIVSLYRWIVAQTLENQALQRDLDDARAEIERRDVELEQAAQDREAVAEEMEQTLDSVREELEQAKQEKQELASSKAVLQQQLSSLSTSQSSSSLEVETLRHRVEDVEREKRDLVVVVSRLKDDGVQREEEIQTLRANLKQARQEYSELESQVRELRSAETATKFKLDSLSQQLQLAREEAERVSHELTAKTEDFARFRREKHGELAQLQATHDELVQTHAATDSTSKALQAAHQTQAHQLTQALTRVQDLTGRLAEQEATYSSEAAGLRRLVEMMEAREAQAKAIVENIEHEWAGVGDRAERREATLREEIEAERQRAEEAERRVHEMQRVLDRVDRAELATSIAVEGGTPSTPARMPGTPSLGSRQDQLMEGMMSLSPTVAMASKSQKGGKTFTQVYREYLELEEAYKAKCVEYENMDRALGNVLAQIEERAPILTQQREEYERMQLEAAQLSSQLAQVLAERDAYLVAAQENEQKLTKSSREVSLLEKQLNDLGRQVRVLLKELGRNQDPSIPSDEELEQDDSTRPPENIEDVITHRLVLFRSIPELQEKNQMLLKIVRELGEKMEVEENDYKAAMERDQQEALQEAHSAILELEKQLNAHKKSSELTIQAYMKERDTLRSMLDRQRTSGVGLSQSVPDGLTGRMGLPTSQSDIEKELEETKSELVSYRTEMGVDSVRLREELSAAQKEAGRSTAALAKANAKVEFLNERHRMLQEEAVRQSREMEQLLKRNQQLHDQYTRVDIECRRASEDLVEANGRAERLRNERANLLAEKKIWENTQVRLVEENKSLQTERSQLSNLMSTVQKMHNDLERAGENDRRRLDSQMLALEHQTQDLRAQLQQERDSIRHLTLQKDIELKDMQTKIDRASEDFAKTRESLIAAQTSKTHLEERVDQLTRQLQGNEEKLAVYERRTNGVSGVTHRLEEDMTREQSLEAEVAELRSALKVAEVDLAAARNHVQQFQEISQASEAALAALNATHDEYKASMEAELAKQKAAHDALQERLDSVEQELTRASEKYAELQRTFETERAAWIADKKTLEETIIDITTAERNSESDRASRESEMRQQEERVKAAEERYSRELVAHAEAVQTIENLKKQLDQAKTAARENSTARETAEAKLNTSEGSWKQQKDSLEKEVSDLNARCKDLAAQNTILHQHLESVSTQAARIRQAADTFGSPIAGDESVDEDAKLSELRSVVAYLRKEKEIVDLQLELSKQENARLKTQIDHLTHNLDETRRTLSEERERAVDAAASDAQHAELVERINQLAILRESNATLRADCEAHARRATELDTRLKQITAELEPAQESLRIAQAELEAKDHQIRRLEEESQRWKERNSQLLSKYDRIDPAEVQALRDEIEQLKTANSRLEGDRSQEMKELSDKITTLEASNSKLKDTGRQNNERARSLIGKANAETERVKAELEQLRKDLAAVSTERDEAKTQIQAGASTSTNEQSQALADRLKALEAEKTTLEKSLEDERASQASAAAAVAELRASVAKLEGEKDLLLAEKATWQSSGASPETGEWVAEKVQLIKARDEASAEARTLKEQVAKTAEDINRLSSSNANLNATIKKLQESRAADSQRALREQQAAVAAAVEKLTKESEGGQAAPELIAQHARELKELEARLAKQHQDQLKAAAEKARREALASAPAGSAGDEEQRIAAAVAVKEEELKKHREEEITAAVERGRMELMTKVKLKDSQMTRVQMRLKTIEEQNRAMEEQIKTWQDSGVVPADVLSLLKAAAAPAAPAAAAPAAKAPAPAPAAPVASTSAAAQPPAKPAAANAAAAPAGARNLPRKPSIPQPHPEGAAGKRPARGMQRPGPGAGMGRGAGRAAGAAASPTAESAGLSIVGAAGKRGREEVEPVADDSLAKRLKPAEGGSKPVQLRRDRVQPPPS